MDEHERLLARMYGYLRRVSPSGAGALFTEAWLRAPERGRGEEELWQAARAVALDHLEDGSLSLVDHRRQALIYEAGGMTPERRADFERHADLCPECADARSRAALAWAGAAEEPPPQSVVAAARAAARKRRARRRLLRAGAFAALAILAIAAALSRRTPASPPWDTDLDDRLWRLEESAGAPGTRRRADTLRRRRSDAEIAQLARGRKAAELEAALERRLDADLKMMEVSLANLKTSGILPPPDLARLRRELESRKSARRAIVEGRLAELLRSP